MTKKITDRPLKRAGRKPTKPPPDAVERVGELAKQGLSIIGIGHAMGVGRDAFRGWLERHPDIKEAFDVGRERERAELHSGLADQARKGNITAAIFLLKARHGYVEGDRGDQASRVAVQINLPAAMSLAEFRAMTAPVIEAKATGDDQ